jgi:non-specific serine/threonine protein kinase
MDPWWNPAAEQQAMDRTHRIGQDEHVFAYRFVCPGTVEEKILRLQERKRNLAQKLIVAESGIFKELERDDLLALFE